MTSIAEKANKSSPSRNTPSPNSNGKAGSKPPSTSSSAAASTGIVGIGTSRLTHQISTGSLMGNMRSTRDRDIMDLVPAASECSYAACFCEENVWKLCEHVRMTNPNELPKAFVVFVSNKKQVRTTTFVQPGPSSYEN
jgi:hypothetical protein